MSLDDKLKLIESVLTKTRDAWFVEGEPEAVINITREELAVIVSSLEIAVGICALLQEIEK